MGSHDIWDGVRKDAEDRVNQDNADKAYNERAEHYNKTVVEPNNEFVRNNPEAARELGFKILDNVEKKEYSSYEHLKNEMAASLASGMRFSNDEAKDFVNRMSALRETMEKNLSDPGWRERERREREAQEEWERQEKWKREHPKEWAEAQRKEQQRARNRIVTRKVCTILCVLLFTIIGGVGFAFLKSEIKEHPVYFIISLSIVFFGILVELKNSNGWGCLGCIVGPIVIFILGYLLDKVLHIDDTSNIITIGVVMGTLIGVVVSKRLWPKY